MKDTATAANDTLDMTCPRAWQNATGVSSTKSSLLIGCIEGKTSSLVHVPRGEDSQCRSWNLQHVLVDQHPKKQDSTPLQLGGVQQKQSCKRYTRISNCHGG